MPILEKPIHQTQPLEHVLAHLSNVRFASRGYLACCPAHDDRHPSLSIREIDDRVLLHCWAGCPTEEILQSLGLQYSDLFAGSQTSRTIKKTPQTIPPKRHNWKRVHHDLLNRVDNFHLRADKIFEAAQEIAINNLKDDDFDAACHCMALAYDAREEAERLEALADEIAHAGRAQKERLP